LENAGVLEMKRIMLIYLMLILVIPSIISAQTSGWKDKGNYKEEILVKSSLSSICISEDGKRFYTLHSNQRVYYWDYNTGQLIDSLVYDAKLTPVQFSKDGKTVTFFDNTNGQPLLKTTICIYDLNSKNLITKSSFKVPGTFDFNRPHGGGYNNSYLIFNLLNYNSLDSTLEVGINFSWSYIEPGVPTYQYDDECGAGGIYKTYKDTIIKIIQLTNTSTLDFIKIDSSYYISNYQKSIDKTSSASQKLISENHTYYFCKFSNSMNNNILLNSYSYWYHWQKDKQPEESKGGNDIPFSKIIFDSLNKIIYVKAESKYYYIKAENDSIYDSIMLDKSAGNELMSKNYKYFIYFKNDTIIIKNAENKSIVDSFICPFEPTMIQLSTDGKGLLAGNNIGNIALFESAALAQKVGWKNKGDFKEMILDMDSLLSLSFSEDGTKFYTLHNNKSVYIWDYKSGVFIDSFVLSANLQYINFASDSKTILGIDNLKFTSNSYSANIYIYDMYSKNIILQPNFKLPGNFDNYKPSYEGSIDEQIKYDKLDYHSIDNTLDLAISFKYSSTSGSGSENYNDYLVCGGSGNFKVINNNLIKNLQLTNLPAYDFVKVDFSYYISLYNTSKSIGGTSIIQTTSIKNNYIFAKIIGSDLSKILFNEFKSYIKFENGKKTDSSYNGSNIPFSKIYYDYLNNTIYVKANSKYYYISSQNDNILDSITFYKSNNNEIMTQDFKYFIYSYGNTIFFQNVKSKAIEDTLICPLIPLILSLSPDGRSLLAADNNGYIALFEKSILDVNDNTFDENKLKIYPNPASDFVNLPESDELIKDAAIFSIFGEKVMQINNIDSNIIDISGLSKGVYFLRINNKSYKFVKV
jgi:hypothetical protein